MVSPVDLSPVDLSYEVTGEGPPLYMVHGIGSRKLTWGGLVPELSKHFTCVTSDLRGHGESPVPPTPYTLDDLVADLEGCEVDGWGTFAAPPDATPDA